MRKLTRTTFETIFCGFLAATLCTPLPAQSEQQQWANAYVHWNFDDSPTDIVDVSQELWVVVPKHGTQWVMQWGWTADPDHGGYLGFNIDENGKGQMIYSIWNAEAGLPNTDVTCMKFDKEETGLSCRMPFEVKNNRFYRLHLQRAEVESEGVWWRASITEEDSSLEEQPSGPSKVHDFTTTYAIGALLAPVGMATIRGDLISNFIEYFGPVKEQCSQVPVSAEFVTPPQANQDASTKKYAYTAHLKEIGTPDAKCINGTEKEGASSMGGPFTLRQYAWPILYPADPPSGDGVIVFLGGDTGKHTIAENLKAISPSPSLSPPPRTVVLYDGFPQ